MFKVSNNLFLGIIAFIFCTNINAIDYKLNNNNVIYNDFNVNRLSCDNATNNILKCNNFSRIEWLKNSYRRRAKMGRPYVKGTQEDTIVVNGKEINEDLELETTNLKSKHNIPQIIRYSTKCRGKNNPYNNHAFLEVIDITKSVRNSVNVK